MNEDDEDEDEEFCAAAKRLNCMYNRYTSFLEKRPHLKFALLMLTDVSEREAFWETGKVPAIERYLTNWSLS